MSTSWRQQPLFYFLLLIVLLQWSIRSADDALLVSGAVLYNGESYYADGVDRDVSYYDTVADLADYDNANAYDVPETQHTRMRMAIQLGDTDYDGTMSQHKRDDDDLMGDQRAQAKTADSYQIVADDNQMGVRSARYYDVDGALLRRLREQRDIGGKAAVALPVGGRHNEAQGARRDASHSSRRDINQSGRHDASEGGRHQFGESGQRDPGANRQRIVSASGRNDGSASARRLVGDNGRRDISEAEQHDQSALVCQPKTPEQQQCIDAAVKNTQDTIEHVTMLMKHMRAHAVSIVKEISELEADFLGSCQDDKNKGAAKTCPPKNKNTCPSNTYRNGGALVNVGGDGIGGAAGAGAGGDGVYFRIVADENNGYNGMNQQNNNNINMQAYNNRNEDRTNNNANNGEQQQQQQPQQQQQQQQQQPQQQLQQLQQLLQQQQHLQQHQQQQLLQQQQQQQLQQQQNDNNNYFEAESRQPATKGGPNNNNNNNNAYIGNNNNALYPSNNNMYANNNNNMNAFRSPPAEQRVVFNEYSAPVKTDMSDIPPSEFMEQAQFAVRSWKQQIEECKRLLDEAMLRAAQQGGSGGNGNDDGADAQQFIKIVKSADEAAALRDVEAAPAPAASLTPTRNDAANNANGNSNANNKKNNSGANDNQSNNNGNSPNNNSNNNKPNKEKARVVTVTINNNRKPIEMKGKPKNGAQSGAPTDTGKGVHGDHNNDNDNDGDNANSKRAETTKKKRKPRRHSKYSPYIDGLHGVGF